MVEDHSASAEVTPAEETPPQYTAIRPDHAGPQYTGDGGQDLRPEPVADFRTEVAPTEFRTEVLSADYRPDFRTEVPRTEFRPRLPGPRSVPAESGRGRPAPTSPRRGWIRLIT